MNEIPSFKTKKVFYDGFLYKRSLTDLSIWESVHDAVSFYRHLESTKVAPNLGATEIYPSPNSSNEIRPALEYPGTNLPTIYISLL